MDVVCSPLPVSTLLWQARPGAWMLTFVCKATFVLQAGESPLSADQEPIHEEDSYWDDDPARSLYAASDLAPIKPRTDVILVGSAFSPGGEPVTSLFARLIVGELDKTVEVVQDRALSPDGQITEGARFTRMPLVYERAAGGPDTWNPVGVRADARDIYGRARLPNLQPPGLLVSSPADVIPPIGFGPIAPSWFSRRDRLGRYASTWSPRALAALPLPEDLDRAFFNAAPRDQQLPALREDARIVLENLHPQVSRLVTNLPGVRPRATFEGRGGAQPLPLRCDTLWIDTDRSICTLTWSGQLPLEHRDEPGRVIITLEGAGVPHLPASAARSSPQGSEPPRMKRQQTLVTDILNPDLEDEGPETQTGGRVAPALPFAPPHREPAPTLPFGPTSAAPREEEWRTPPNAGLPFMQSGMQSAPRPDPAVPAAPPWSGRPPSTPPGSAAASASWQSTPAPPPAHSSSPSWPAQQAPAPPPPPPVPAPVPSPRQAGDSAWPPPAVRSDPPAGARSSSDPPLAARSSSDPPLAARSIGEAAVAAAGGIAMARQDATSGVLAASNAAASIAAGLVPARRADAPTVSSLSGMSGSAVRPAARLDSREVLHLIWYNPESVARACRVPAWRAILDAMENEPPDDELDDPAPTRDPADIEDRRDIFEILARGASQDVDQLNEELTAAVRPGGKFVPPLLLLAGDLSFPFDERETLKAAVAVATPVAGPDEAFKATIREGRDFLSTPDVVCPPPLVEGYTTRIREAFQRNRRGLSADYLDVQMERALLEGRHYQRRQVLGMTAIRAFLHTAAGTGARPAPVYLPDDLARKLPLYQRFRARLIAELYLQEDQYEQHPAALKAFALGRVTTALDRR